MSINFTLLTDGSSDRALLPIVQWTFRQHVGKLVAITGAWADFAMLRARPSSLVRRIETALDLFPCDVLVIHRDAERQDPQLRHDEIETAFGKARTGRDCRHLCVVPVRMTEAWLLFNEPGIRRAAGNPNGTTELNLPGTDECEDVSDPKFALLSALRTAYGLKGRRLKTFSAETARARLADLIEDYSPLRQLSAFQRFERDVLKIISASV